MNQNVKYCAVASALTQEILVQETLDVQKKDLFEREVMNVLKKESNSLQSDVNKTLKKEGSYGILYYRSTNSGKNIYFTLAKASYSYNRILSLLADMQRVNNQYQEDERKLSNSLYDLLRQYDANPTDSSSDSFSQARSTIDSITSQVKGNVEQVIKNQTQLSDIEGKSKSLSDSSRGFMDQSRKLEKQLKDRRRKTYIIIGSIIFLVILAIILFFSM